LYEHAEHYFRVVSANREGAQQGIAPRPITLADAVMDGPEQEPDESSQSGWGDDRTGFM
jgi:hypothetical protein